MKHSYLSILWVLPALALAGKPREWCKPRPGDYHWPSAASWKALNESVNGQLSISTPPAAACHSDRPEYNNATCAFVASQWFNTTFHKLDTVSADYNDDTCLPRAAAPCSADGYPEYVITARNIQDVQEGIKFAKNTSVRLVIRGTGHDVPGRSSGGDSLSIYTHNIRGLDIEQGDPRATALGGVASIKIHAGETMYDVYRFAAQEKVLPIGGADPGVGIGGWISGGGHSPVTPRYGMGADQVLEMEVVTADGEYRTINTNCDPDLFWALRGGGAGTFAVLISVTVKVYAPIPASVYLFAYNTTIDSDTFWSLTASFHQKLPHLAESGLTGYYFAIPDDAASAQGILYGVLYGLNLSEDQTQAIMDPVEEEFRSAQWGDAVKVGSILYSVPDWSAWYAETRNQTGEDVGVPALRLGSWLLSNDSLLGDFDKLKNGLRTTTPAPLILLGHLIAPAPNTQHPTGGVAGGSNAILPAWRKAYTQIALPRSWIPLNQSDSTKVTTDLRDVQTKALRELEPSSGAYQNEADPTEPNWQKTKFGNNYRRLLDIKHKWDPSGVFWCKQCVGSELWNLRGDFGIENGVGQNKVQLCRQDGGRGRGGHGWELS